MKRKNEAGFSLIEVLVSITILAAVVLPTCSALVLGIQLNDKTDALMRAQLSVSSAVETLMARGNPAGTPATGDDGDYGNNGTTDLFPDVKIKVTPDNAANPEAASYYNVEVTSNDALVQVTTSVAASHGQEGGA